jgi:hypothetical protein
VWRRTSSRERYAQGPTPAAGARVIARLFNQRHVPHMTVQKSWVADRLREHAAAVVERRRELRRRTPSAPALCVGTQRILDLAKLAYNECRPHQALGGLTPMQVWRGMNWDDVARENGLRGSLRVVIGERRRW